MKDELTRTVSGQRNLNVSYFLWYFFSKYFPLLLLQCHYYSNNGMAPTSWLWYHPIGEAPDTETKHCSSCYYFSVLFQGLEICQWDDITVSWSVPYRCLSSGIIIVKSGSILEKKLCQTNEISRPIKYVDPFFSEYFPILLL